MVGETTLLPAIEPPRILVVDDEIVITEILADFLSMEGWIIDTASSGPAAMALLEERSFDLMISDLKMPEMSGLDLMVKAHARRDNMVIIIMTAFGTVETAIQAMKKGAFDYILKPFKMEEVVQIVQRALEMKRLADENIQLKSTLSLYKLSEELDFTLSLNEMLDSILDFCQRHVEADEIAIYLQDKHTGELELRRKLRMDESSSEITLNIERLSQEMQTSSFVITHGEETGDLLDSVDDVLGAFVSVPMIHRSQRVGLVNAIARQSGMRFTEGQRKLLSIISGRAAVSIVNSQLMEELRETVRQTIQSLARALEAIDRYTAGHSDRVMLYSRLICEHIGMSEDEVTTITQAALMHDIGKIGCHANLNKPDKLTAQEYEIFKEHPTHGKKILEPLTFLHPMIPGVHLHHERWDGKGYPVGLVGDAIPLSARILAVADSYDAMTSSRAYRKALSHKVAMVELNRCSGTQFDPAMVEAFTEVITRYRQEYGDHGETIPS